MKVLLLSGKSGHGKDQTASFMREELEKRNLKVMIIHFGDPVKWFASAYMGYRGIKDSIDRQILQKLGTEIMRAKYPTYWGDMIAQFISATTDLWDVVIVPDTRFFNEIDSIKKYNDNVNVIRIERMIGREKFENPNMTETQRLHISETQLDNAIFDYIIENNGDLKDLKEASKSCLDIILNL